MYVAAISSFKKQPSTDELENLLISHKMMLVKVGTLKIEDKEEAMFSRVPSQSHAANPKIAQKKGERQVVKATKAGRIRERRLSHAIDVGNRDTLNVIAR